ncbi:MAG TPA: NAD-dependent epimerase/dehydratase family protein [Anaerolineae bacterium]|nr:NAD-dependent epimerase/dehydratase family protein [Anaerolineae bacterium]
MNLLIIGGTRFVGRHLVETALSQGHKITLFNRGQSNPGLFSDVEEIHGDRATDLDKLDGRSWDVVIDTCGYFPEQVAASAEKLANHVKLYVFISTISVYKQPMPADLDENGPLDSIKDKETTKITTENYGPLKVLCEEAVIQHFPDNCLIIRPGLIVGPYDPTDRFTYWVRRAAEGGRAIAPDRPDMAVQVIDGRDLAEWTIEMSTNYETGIYNAVGPETPLAFGQLLDICRDATQGNVHWEYLPEPFLLENNIMPWLELPLWLPIEETDNFSRINHDKALAKGMTHRPMQTIVTDTLAWHKTRPADINYRAGLDTETETEVLAKWDESQ